MPAKKTIAKKRPATKGTRKGKGMGWGGPAKGGGGNKKAPFNGSKTAGPGRGKFSLEGEERAARNTRHAEEMRSLYYEFALDPNKDDGTRLSAATHLLNRLEGSPVAKILTGPTDELANLTDEQLAAELAQQRAKAAALTAEAAAPEAKAARSR